MTTGKFSATEWKQLVNAPQLIHHLLTTSERRSATFFGKRSEAKALEEYLSSYQSQSALVQSIIAGQKDADTKIKASAKEAQTMLEQVGALLEAKADDAEGDAVRDFLMNAGETIAKAVREQLRAGGTPISSTEEKTLATIASALKATDTDKHRRREATMAADARKRTEEELRAKRDAEAQKRAQEEKAKREAEAKKKVEEEKAEREEKAKKYAESLKQAQAKKAEEEKAKKYAESIKQAQAKKAELEKAKLEAEAAKRDAVPVQPAAQAGAKGAETVYVVKPGDTLSGIAKSIYGNAGRWREIFEANKDIIENPNLIRPGWKLRIPD